MPIIPCPRTGCTYETPDLDAAQSLKLVEIHAGEHTNATLPAAQQQTSNVEKIRRPAIETGVTLERWVYFVSRWKRYKKLSELKEEMAAAQLLECADEELLVDLHRNNGERLDNMTEEELLKEMKGQQKEVDKFR